MFLRSDQLKVFFYFICLSKTCHTRLTESWLVLETEKSTLKDRNGPLLYHCMEGVFDLEVIPSTQSYNYAGSLLTWIWHDYDLFYLEIPQCLFQKSKFSICSVLLIFLVIWHSIKSRMQVAHCSIVNMNKGWLLCVF